MRIPLLGTCPQEIKTTSITKQGLAAHHTQKPTLLWRKGKNFYLQVAWQRDRRQGSNLSPQLRVQVRFKGSQHRIVLDN